MKLLAGAVALTTLLAACAGPDGEDDPDFPEPEPLDHTWTRFIAIGDAGMANAAQLQVAQAIEEVCLARRCDFAIDLGDLIYPSGVDSPDDPQFESKFEVPYENLSFPFYMVLGNHDNYGTLGGAAGYGLEYDAGNHMVAYAARTDRASEKWQMPGRFYSVTPGNGNTTFIGLDTNTLGFHDVPTSPQYSDEIEQQQDFVDAALADISTPWVFAMGHHPYISNGPHGDAGEYDGAPTNGDYVKEFFEDHLCGKIDVYFAGHDHNLQWLEPVSACADTEFVISGGGGAGTYDLGTEHEARFQEQTLGFWWFEANATTLNAIAFDEEAEPLFQYTMTK